MTVDERVHKRSDDSILRGAYCTSRGDLLTDDWAEVTCRLCLGDRQCEATTTVQLGPMSATNLTCMLSKRTHPNQHRTGRRFGHVEMTATWPGQWEASDA